MLSRARLRRAVVECAAAAASGALERSRSPSLLLFTSHLVILFRLP
jgi:hypothetical protein